MGGLQLQSQSQSQSELQMSWQAGLLSQKRKSGPPLGLKNLGNSCYLNSVLQCLTYTPPLANFCLRLQHSSLCDSAAAASSSSAAEQQRKRDCPFCVLEKRIARSLSVDLTLDAPAKMQSCLRIFAEHFRCGRQEDAHEFLRYVIDACHNTCLRLKKLRRKGMNESVSVSGGSSSSTVVKEIFGGALQSQVKCLSCNSESNKIDEIMDISLDVLHSNSLRDAMQKFFQPEILDGNNKYKCENCKKLVAARKQMSIIQAPNILVIQLKRFEGIFGAKIDKAITFEEVLVLSSFMCKGSQDPQPEYNLFGTIVHSGCSPESGHYYAYIKDAMGRWYCCNDSYVTVSTLQDVLSEKVYILFFSRKNQRPASATTNFAANGVKSSESNGSPSEGSRNPKAAVPVKEVSKKHYVEQPSRADVSTTYNVDKMPPSSRIRFNIIGNSGSKKAPLTVEKKVDSSNGQNMEINGHAKDSVHLQKLDKDMSSAADKENLSKNRKNCAVEGQTCQAFGVANGHGFIQNGIGTISRGTTERGLDNLALQNGSMNHHSDAPGSKRKLKEDSSILFAEDAQSQAKVEELKEVLKQEASSVLRSCGWSDKVHSFMCLRKRLCLQDSGDTPSANDLKKLLIAEAKRTFISQIPESLKEELVKHLQTFSQGK